MTRKVRSHRCEREREKRAENDEEVQRERVRKGREKERQAGERRKPGIPTTVGSVRELQVRDIFALACPGLLADFRRRRSPRPALSRDSRTAKCHHGGRLGLRSLSKSRRSPRYFDRAAAPPTTKRRDAKRRDATPIPGCRRAD